MLWFHGKAPQQLAREGLLTEWSKRTPKAKPAAPFSKDPAGAAREAFDRISGKNYDVELFHPNGELICADTKCKVETTAISDATVAHTLRHAQRKQIPSDGNGIIFVKVPQRWMDADGREGFKDRFRRITRAFFNGTTRVVSLVPFSSILRFPGGNEIQQGVGGTEFTNHRRTEKDWRMLSLYDEHAPMPVGYVQLADLFPEEMTSHYGFFGGSGIDPHSLKAQVERS
jgi:hypothetical protein